METSLYNESNYYTSWADKSVKSDRLLYCLSNIFEVLNRALSATIPRFSCSFMTYFFGKT